MEISEFLINFLIICGIFWLYMLPTMIALMRESNRWLSIAIVNLFLGWSLIAWVVCLAWAMYPENKVMQNG